MQLMTEITRGLDRMNEHKVELIYQLLMDNDLTALHNYAARTGRFAATPTPPSYARHSSALILAPAVHLERRGGGAGAVGARPARFSCRGSRWASTT